MKSWENAENRIPAGREVTSLILEVFRVNGALIAAGDVLVRPFGLTSARWQVMGAVRGEARTVSSIARRMGLRRQSVQRTVNRLRADGFVCMRDNPAHSRARLVALTEKGCEALLLVEERQTTWSNGLGAALVETGADETDIAAAWKLLRSLADRLDADNGGEHG